MSKVQIDLNAPNFEKAIITDETQAFHIRRLMDTYIIGKVFSPKNIYSKYYNMLHCLLQMKTAGGAQGLQGIDVVGNFFLNLVDKAAAGDADKLMEFVQLNTTRFTKMACAFFEIEKEFGEDIRYYRGWPYTHDFSVVGHKDFEASDNEYFIEYLKKWKYQYVRSVSKNLDDLETEGHDENPTPEYIQDEIRRYEEEALGTKGPLSKVA